MTNRRTSLYTIDLTGTPDLTEALARVAAALPSVQDHGDHSVSFRAAGDDEALSAALFATTGQAAARLTTGLGVHKRHVATVDRAARSEARLMGPAGLRALCDEDTITGAAAAVEAGAAVWVWDPEVADVLGLVVPGTLRALLAVYLRADGTPVDVEVGETFDQVVGALVEGEA